MKTIILMFALISVSSGCAHSVKQPSDTLFEYYEALNSGDYSLAYDFLASADKRAVTESEYVDHHVNNPYQESFARLIEHTLVSEIITSDIAVVNVKTKHPNQEVILPIIMFSSFQATSALEGKEKLHQFIDKKLELMKKDGSIDYVYGDITVNMVMENNEWKLTKLN